MLAFVVWQDKSKVNVTNTQELTSIILCLTRIGLMTYCKS